MIRYPALLQPGDRIGVTSPSSGVPADLTPRFEFCVSYLRSRGYDVVVGSCMDGSGVVSAPAADRAAELTAMMTDPTIRAIIPPWGGELAIELFPHLDFSALATDSPPWLIGYSDLSTLLLPLTCLTGVATLHGQNLMDTPLQVPSPLLPWLSAVTGAPLVQGPSTLHKPQGFLDWVGDPELTEYPLTLPGTWSLLDPSTGPLGARGRLIGGCIETVSILAGTPFGSLSSFAAAHAPEGLIVYLEAAEDNALNIARSLWRLRLAGWFDHANAILIGRTNAPASGSFTQVDAVRSALGDLGLPIVLDVDCGHVAPHLALVNGALTEVVVDGSLKEIRQTLA